MCISSQNETNVLGAFLWNITQAAAVATQEKLQWRAGRTRRFITWLFQQEIQNQLPNKKKEARKQAVKRSSHLDTLFHQHVATCFCRKRCAHFRRDLLKVVCCYQCQPYITSPDQPNNRTEKPDMLADQQSFDFDETE